MRRLGDARLKDHGQIIRVPPTREGVSTPEDMGMSTKMTMLAALTTRRNQGLIGQEDFLLERQRLLDAPETKAEVTVKRRGERPGSGMILAALSVVIGFFPFGIIAVVKAAKVDPLWDAGKYDVARAQAENALSWALTSFVCGISLGLIAILLLK